MTRRLWISLIGIVLITVGSLAGNLATGNTPILGLDLQGGLSVILAPDEDASSEDLIGVRDLVRESLEASGVAEPDVRVQGANIVVDLPGVKDKDEALEAVKVSGIVALRPVLNFTDCSLPTQPEITFGDGDVGEVDAGGGGGGGEIVTPDTPVVAPDDVEESTGLPEAEVNSTGGPIGFRRTAPDSVPADSVPADSDPAEIEPVPEGSVPSDSVPSDSVPSDSVPSDSIPEDLIPALDSPPIVAPPTAPGADFLPTLDGRALCVGPSQGSGEIFERRSADTVLGNGWGVTVDLRGDGETAWNSLATQCFNRLPACPSTGVDTNGSGRPGQIAIVLDNIIQSAPVVNTPVFNGQVSITGQFSEDEARQLTEVLNRGAFPVQVTPQETRTVSASAGGDSLKAAIIAGLLGVVLVLAFLVLYYRWLALVIISGLIVWGLAVFSAASLVSGWTNYALSLAGVTGIIVAVGVTVDSYVVFFERMKDEIRNGRTLRNAAPRSFNSTWRTIWSADLVSIIGSLILFWLSVGSVRGFALYLGITTICDLIVCFFFTRPAVLLIARSKFMAGRRAFGLDVVAV